MVTEWIKKIRPLHTLTTRDSIQTEKYTHTEPKEMEKHYFMKMEIKF